MRFSIFALLIGFLFIAVTVSCNSAGKPGSGSALFGSDNDRAASFSLKNKREIPPRRPPAADGYAQYYPCDKGMQANGWAFLTPRERMLANGYEELDETGNPYKPAKTHRPVYLVASMLATAYHAHRTIPKNVHELAECAKSMGLGGDGLEEYFAEMLTSPVTGEVIDWNCPNFSAGNAFVTIINENKDAYKLAEERLAEAMKGHDDDSRLNVPKVPAKDKIHVYIRVYGNSGVIDNCKEYLEWGEAPGSASNGASGGTDGGSGTGTDPSI